MQSLSLISDSLYIDCVYLSYLNTHIILDRPDRPQPCKIRGGLKLILTVSGPQAPSSWSPVNCVHVMMIRFLIKWLRTGVIVFTGVFLVLPWKERVSYCLMHSTEKWSPKKRMHIQIVWTVSSKNLPVHGYYIHDCLKILYRLIHQCWMSCKPFL